MDIEWGIYDKATGKLLDGTWTDKAEAERILNEVWHSSYAEVRQFEDNDNAV